MKKKAQLNTIQQLMIGITVLGLVLVIALLIMGEAKTINIEEHSGDWCSSPFVYNSSANVCCNASSTCTGVNRTTPVWNYAFNGSNSAIDATQDVSGWLAVVVVAVIGVALLGILTIFRNH